MNDVRTKAKIDNRARFIGEASALYYPFERLPEVKLTYYAYACLETALSQSEYAFELFNLIGKCWGLPGCQPVIDEFAKHSTETRAYFNNIAKAAVNNRPMPEFPEWAMKVSIKYQDEEDFRKLLYVKDLLIVAGFNRKIDLENQTLKVCPSGASYLTHAISLYSLMEYLQANPRAEKNPDHIELGKQIDDFYQVLGANPTNREGRRLRKQIVTTLSKKGFILCHDATMLKGAEQWYKCRVNPGSVEAYRDELAQVDCYLERSNLENAIAPYDEATGYPRRWRK